MTIYNESISADVWAFVKKHTGSMIAAGILAMIISNYIKKNKKKESISERLEKLYKVTFIDVKDNVKSLNVDADSKTDAIHKVITFKNKRQLKSVK